MSEHAVHTKVRIGSEKSFGLVFAGVFLIVAVWPLWGEGAVRLWALAVSAAFAGLAYLRPKVLAPLNRLWFRFGMLLSRIVSPVVMAILFVGTVVPTGLVMRALGRDPLRAKPDLNAKSYWIEVDPESAAKSSMRNQF